MNYVSCAEAAKAMSITSRRVQQLCKSGDIPGAKKEGRSWMVPENALSLQLADKKKPLPIGVSDYRDASENYYYVDKTMMIKEFLDERPKVSLFTRPRRFGKTLNMDMLRTFFEKSSEDTSIYFQDKKIHDYGPDYWNEQGRYPVIFLTFKDVKCTTWESTYDLITKLVLQEFLRHTELAASEAVTNTNCYHRIITGQADENDYMLSLMYLSQMLHEHYGIPPIIIIDEYDTPILQGHSCGFYDKCILFMRNFFSAGLKDNPHLSFGFLTGILRVAKESIFSELNNLKTNSILDESYSEYFGFTMEEVKELLRYYRKEEKLEEVCTWYDGYRFGSTRIFNPWSIINYVADKCLPRAYWQSTGSNDIIGEIISAATPEITEGLHRLLCGERITTYVDTSVIYPEVQNDPYRIYSFLLIAGYLKVDKVYPQFDGNYMCEVAIPNKEIAYVYEKEVLNRTSQNGIAISIQQAIFSGDTHKLQTLLEDFMLHSISSLDSANESFYHGMMLGLCAVLGNRYQVRSNRESGLGRFDIQLTPRTKGIPGFLFEFKHTGDPRIDLDALADTALQQIDYKRYDTELLDAGVSSIIKIGIAFRGKTAVVKCA